VQRQKIIWMYSARSHPTVVAIDTFLFFVATRAEAAVVASNAAMAQEPVGAMSSVLEPIGRNQGARSKLGFQTRPIAQMTRRALAARRSRCFPGTAMTHQAPQHAGKLIAAGMLEPLDRAMTLRTTDVSLGMNTMIEL
jgi:hypothetical protein